MKKGDMVEIVGSAEEEKYRGCVFEVLSEPYDICGSKAVKIKCHETGKYFGGGYAMEFLRLVNDAKPKCGWCNKGYRFEFNWIDDEGHTVTTGDNMVIGDIADFCPMCGRECKNDI